MRRLPPMSMRTIIPIKNKVFGTAAPAHYCHQQPSTPNGSPNHDITPLMKTKPLSTGIRRRIFLMRWSVSSTSILPAQAASVVPWIPARQHYTSGGLERPWRGFVWLNPPYGRHILMPWLEKFVQHGNGIALVPERTSTGWWQEAASRSDLLLFVKQRIPFISSTRDDTTACAIGSTLIAIGERGTRGLITASRNELGLLLKPYKGQ